MENSAPKVLKLKVTEGLSKDVGRALARMGPEDLERLEVALGDPIEVVGKRKTFCKAMPSREGFAATRAYSLTGLPGRTTGQPWTESGRFEMLPFARLSALSWSHSRSHPMPQGSSLHCQPGGRYFGPGSIQSLGRTIRQPLCRFQGRKHYSPRSGPD